MKYPDNQKPLFKAILDLDTKVSKLLGPGYGQGLLDMLTHRTPVGVVATACRRAPTAIFDELAAKGALHLTVEALALRAEFAEIIPAMTRAAARRRLANHGAPTMA